MSYCVNCGVELRDSEMSCALCNTTVQNPKQPINNNSEPAFPKRIDQFQKNMDKQLTILILSVLIVMPAVICIAINITLSRKLSWSIYVAGAMFVLWVFIVPLYLFSKKIAAIPIFIDAIFLLLYMALIEKISPMQGWFWQLAFPIIVGSAILSSFVAYIIQYKKIPRLYITSIIFACTGVMTIFLEIVTDIYSNGIIKLGWSLIGFFSLILISSLIVFTEKKRSVKSSIGKKLHL